MTKPIQTYQDLLDERQRLEALLQLQKEAVHQDILELKAQLGPVTSALSMAGKLVTRDKGNLILNAGAHTVIDLVVKKLILSRAGWITKLVVPFFLKNYSSHVIADNKESLAAKLFSWIGKKNANGQPHTHN